MRRPESPALGYAALARTTAVILAVIATATLITACSDDDAGEGVILATATVGTEKTFGTINHLPGGAATITSDHVLESITCESGQLTMVTSAGRFVGTMDCAAQVSQETIDMFVGKPILITITETRLKIENPEAGSLDYPATNVQF